jgi:hypothetical protein
MSSRKPQPDAELDRLIRETLQARTSGQEPPDRVWKRIQLALATDKAPSRRLSIPWSPLVVQVALTLLLVMVGGIGLQGLSNPGGVHPLPDATLPLAPTLNASRPSLPMETIGISDESDIQLLRTLSKPKAVPRVETGANDHPPLFVPQDVPPHPWSPEGRLLAAEHHVVFYTFMPGELVLGGPAEK